MSELSCPTCYQPTTVIDRFRLGSTSGPVEHVRISCPNRHHYMMPLEGVPAASDAATAPARETGTSARSRATEAMAG